MEGAEEMKSEKLRLQKLLAQPSQSIGNTLDNMASVEQIMSFLESKRKGLKMYKYVSSLTRQQQFGKQVDMYEHFTTTGQPLNLFSEKWDGGLPTGYFGKISHKSMLPKIITDPQHLDKDDPVATLLQAKHKWNKQHLEYRKLMGMKLKKAKPYRWIDDDVLYCPKYYVDYAAHIENDPDRLFDDNYNWYYAGQGNMLTTSIHGIDYIIHSEFNCLNISQFYKDTMTIDQKNSVTYECPKDMNIFETAQQLNYIALRFKHKIKILKIIDKEEGIKLEQMKELESELPYTRISFDDYHKNILYITTLDYMLTIVNLDRMTCRKIKLRGKFLTLTDNLNYVTGSEREYFIHVTDTAITYYDKRTCKPVQRWKSMKYQTDYLCNRILATKFCDGKPQMYTGTTHHLFLIDMRYNTEAKTKPKSVMRWTHGMRSKMTNIGISTLDHNTDIIAMVSHWAPDLCYVTNFKDILTRHSELNSICMPYRPPDLIDAYNGAQRKGLCCNLYEPTIERLTMSVTGLSIVQGEKNPRILLHNSMGDISCYDLYSHNMTAYIDDDGVDNFYEWTMKLNKRTTKSNEVSHLFDMSSVWNNLKRIPDTYELGYQSYIKRVHKFNEQEIFDTFESGDVDSEFLEAWKEGDEVGEIELQANKADYRDIDTDFGNAEPTRMEMSDDEF